MKSSTKVIIGLSILTTSGVYVKRHFSDQIKKKLEYEVTRYNTKKVINEKFGGNEKLLSIVNDLSDKELEAIGRVVKEVKTFRKND